ncbi:formamidopyrimidine-DNA glycosylase/AP lyase [Streptomyces sp. NBRC 110611]|uniref:Fpg/Nei family DNA glycosylase n=1 Tax=Streptomyces sp. NBRC 110611 TaxID=1621259 RepID=UPI000831B40B|nr:DNA-formamidopyrimidine glycosylase family protein [Streptomyces sp. NBRC 110611]GAU69320.1 formamidopyrimidine-DNA glycosylase/AP lyase [Streptomyces sp. NBRC 110611]
MPELPDVEAFRRILASCAQGRVIRRIEVRDPGVLHGIGATRLRRALEGRRFGRPERHGKWLIARTGGPTLLLHFGMTGELVCATPGDPVHAHDRVVFTVRKDRQLRYRDQRKLQGLWLVDDDGLTRMLGDQGPDAATATAADLRGAVAGRHGTVKSVLMDQSALAGLGNLLADEILWRARLHPARRARGLTDDECTRLHAELRRTLRAAVRAGRVPPRRSWLTGHRDDPNPACPRCAARLHRGRSAGRGTVWCPRCQPDPTARHRPQRSR